MNNLENKNNAGKTTGFALSLVAAAALAGAPAVAQAQSGSMQPAGWSTAVTLYGWFPSFGGESQYPTVGNPINVSADTIIDNLKFVFMGSLDVHNGRWGAFTDLIYMDVGGGKQNTRDFTVGNAGVPVGITADVNLDIKAWVWTLAGEYRVAAGPALTMDVLAGARSIVLKERLNWSITGSLGSIGEANRTGASEAKETLLDAIVGVKGRYVFGASREWSAPFYFDVGAGGSTSTFQAAAGIGYAFKWGELSGLWRYLDYNFKSNKAIQDVSFSGPMIGATFRW
jgi:hypothetical protein